MIEGIDPPEIREFALQGEKITATKVQAQRALPAQPASV